ASPLIASSADTVLFDTTMVDSTSILELGIDNAGITSLNVTDIISTNPDFSVDLSSFILAAGMGQMM
ncbi:MAG: hypothetical protein P8048_11450, partial [Calditrichia bacterium]